MQRLVIAGVVATALTLTGCAAPSGDPIEGDSAFRIQEVTLPDGRVVTCLIYDDSATNGASLDCDWGTANLQLPTLSDEGE